MADRWSVTIERAVQLPWATRAHKRVDFSADSTPQSRTRLVPQETITAHRGRSFSLVRLRLADLCVEESAAAPQMMTCLALDTFIARTHVSLVRPYEVMINLMGDPWFYGGSYGLWWYGSQAGLVCCR